MGIGSSIKILLKAAAVNYVILLLLFIIMFFIDEQSRSTSAPDDMGGVFYVIIYFTAYYWIIGGFIYLTLGLILHRLMLSLQAFEIKHMRNFALVTAVCFSFPVIFLGGIIEAAVSFIVNSLFIYFTAWLVRRFTLRKLSNSKK